MTPYTLNGRPTAFWRGDWFVGKGVAHARLRMGPEPEDVVEVFNTHTHAPYASDAEDSYRVHREAQAWTLAKLLRGAAERGHLVVAAGDFNTTPLSTEHRLVTGHAPVRDVWRVLHPDSSLGSADHPAEKARAPRGPVPTAAHNVLENGATSNNVYNTWRWSASDRAKLGPGKPLHEIPLDAPDPRGQRLDYIFASTAARDLGEASLGGWVVSSARVGMLSRHPELGCSLSDHFSVEATLVFHATTTTAHTVGTSTIGGQGAWPLPPGRLSNLSAFRRRSTPLHPQQQAERRSTADDDDLEIDDLHSPRAGAFLSLQSPTPSTSRQPSLGQPADDDAARPDVDFDGQLLSSLMLPDGPHPREEVQFTVADYDALLTSIKLYVSREADQARLRAAHFAFWVFVLVACCIAVWFVPTRGDGGGGLNDSQNHAVNFVLLLLSSLGLVAGCVDGLMALLFFQGNEKRALKEFEWEVSNAKALAIGDVGATYHNAGSAKY